MKAKLNGTYLFRDKDPVADFLRAPFEDCDEHTTTIATRAGIAPGTINNLFYGKTRKPQFATVVRLARAIGRQGEDALVRCVRTGARGLSVVEGGKGRKAG